MEFNFVRPLEARAKLNFWLLIPRISLNGPYALVFDTRYVSFLPPSVLPLVPLLPLSLLSLASALGRGVLFVLTERTDRGREWSEARAECLSEGGRLC